ncbi:MAG: hypothetical protein IVW55_00515 [Chloroflexi bacterium]|nr:hypothetical protein [Chloroflexota bacterium]
MHLFFIPALVFQLGDASGGWLPGRALHLGSTWLAGVLLQVGPEQAICNMLDAIKGWTSILVIAAAIAIGFALILRGLAPEFSNQFQGAIRSVIVGLIVIAILPLIATFILTTLGATGTGSGCA